MPNITVTYDSDQWQLVPRAATRTMLMELKPRAGEIVKMIKEDGGKRLNFSCDFGLAYRMMLASAPVHVPPAVTEVAPQVCAGGIDPGFEECPKCGATSDDECGHAARS